MNINGQSLGRSAASVLAYSGGTFFTISGGNTVTIDGFDYTGVHFINYTAGNDLHVKDCYFTWSSAWGENDIYLSTFNTFEFADNYVDLTADVGAALQPIGSYNGAGSSSTVSITGNYFLNSGAYATYAVPVNLSSCQGEVSNNTFDANDIGILIANNSGNLTIENNNFINATDGTEADGISGIKFWGNGGTILSGTVNISNNSFSNCDFGINTGYSPDFSGQAVNINNNSIVGCTFYAIRNNGTGTFNATCNWFGTNDPSIITTVINYQHVANDITLIPFLPIDGTYTPGFTPADGSCTGTCNTPAPTGAVLQSSCASNSHTVADLYTWTGTNIKWYDAASGGNLLSSSTALVNGNHYYASQTTNDGCESTNRLDVTVTVSGDANPVPAILSNNIDITNTTINLCDGSTLDFTATPSHEFVWNYEWTDGTNFIGSYTDYAVGGPAGPYYVTVTDDNGCTGIASVTININEASAELTVVSITQPTCIIQTGSVDLSGMNVDINSNPIPGTWTITASPGGATQTGTSASTTFTGLAPGDTYAFSVNQNGCASNPSIQANINTLTGCNSISCSNGTTFCAGASSSVSYTATGTFVSGNVFTAELSNASGNFPGTSIGTVAATTSGNISVTIPSNAVGTHYKIRVNASNPAVSGTDNGSDITIKTVTPGITGSTSGCGAVTLTATGGGTYSWSGGSTLATQTFLNNATYSVTVTNNGCSSSTSVNVNGITAIKVHNVTQNTYFCNIQPAIDAANANDEIQVSAGTYNESLVINKSITLNGAGSDLTILDGNSATENYYMVSIEADNVTVENLAITNPLYNSTADASGIVTANAGTMSNIHVSHVKIHDVGALNRPSTYGTYGINCGPVNGMEIDHCEIYNIGDGDASEYAFGILLWGNSPSETANNVNIHDNYIHDITNPSSTGGIDAGGDASEVTINANTLTGPFTTYGGIRTSAYMDGYATITNNVLTGASDAGIILNNPFAQTVTGNSVSGATIGIKVGSSCTILPSISLNSITNCTNGLTNLASDALSATCNWWGSTSLNTVSGLISGTSHFTPYLSNGNDASIITGFQTNESCSSCNVIASISETDNSATHDDGQICNGASANLNAGSHALYSWSNGTSNQSMNVSPTTTTLYIVTVTDNNGCSLTATKNIVVNNNPTPSITETDNSGTTNNDAIICNGKTATLNASSYTYYSWTGSATSQSITVTPSTSTTYVVTVTDGNGCTGTTSQAITVNANPTPSITFLDASGNTNNDGIICLNASATVQTGSFNAYSWSNASTAQSFVVTPTATTNYVVTVTNSNGCTATSSANVVVNTNPVAANTAANIACYGGTTSINVTATGGTSPYTGTGIYSSLSASTTPYSYTVTDANGCKSTTSRTLTAPVALTYTVTKTNAPGCVGGTAASITINATGGTGSKVYSDNANAVTPTYVPGYQFTGLVATSYSVRVKDANNCLSSISTLVIGTNPAMVITPTSVANTPCDGKGKINVAVTGGSGFYNYSITGPSGTYQATNVFLNVTKSATPYTVWVKDGTTGCSASGTVTVTSPCRLGTEENNTASTTDFTIYPNPATNHATVIFSASKEENFSVRLVDVMGRIVMNETNVSVIGENQLQMNLSSLSKGIYMLVLQNSDGMQQRKLVVQ